MIIPPVKKMELIELLKDYGNTLTLNQNQYYMYPMVTPSFSTFSALISSYFWSYSDICIFNIYKTVHSE